jgi:hypothetical protein
MAAVDTDVGILVIELSLDEGAPVAVALHAVNPQTPKASATARRHSMSLLIVE